MQEVLRRPHRLQYPHSHYSGCNKWKGKQLQVSTATSSSSIHHLPPKRSLSPGEELQNVIADMDPTVQFMCSVEASTWEANLARAEELADEAKEEADYQAALAASLSHSPPHNDTHSSPSYFASTSPVTSSHFSSSSCIASSSHIGSSSHVRHRQHPQLPLGPSGCQLAPFCLY